MTAGWLLASLLAGSASADPYQAELRILADRLETGNWNERIRSVRQLGAIGPPAAFALERALADPDWQVRLTAAHSFGRLGRAGAQGLLRGLREESCPLVRMSAENVLGRLGIAREELPPPTPPPEDPEEACRSWYWPAAKTSAAGRSGRVETKGATGDDPSGCSYIRYDRPGAQVCPDGTEVRGIGAAPGALKILKGTPPLGGVALCCPPEASGAGTVRPPEPAEVECRLHPMECPPPWKEMLPPDRKRWSGRDQRHRRDAGMRDGAIHWVHCCRPLSGTAPPAPEAPESRLDAWRESQPPPAPGPEAEEPAADFENPGPEPPPELDTDLELRIARRALSRKRRQPAREAARERGPQANALEREEELLALLGDAEELPDPWDLPEREEPGAAADAGKPGHAEALTPELDEEPALPDEEEELPSPLGPGPRAESPVAAPARRADSGREGVDPDLEPAPSGLGAPQGRLAGPRVPVPRGRPPVSAGAGLAPDHGGPGPRHDAVPALMSALEHASDARRARAAELLGSLGPEAKRAVPSLRAALRDRSPRVRASAALALGGVTQGSDDSVRALKRALRDEHPDVRYSAARALGRIGTPAARDAFGSYMRREARRYYPR